jgi:putative ABC transport system permease protein
MSHFLLLKNGVDNISFVSQFNKTIGQYQTRVDSFGIQKLTDIYLSEYKDENGNRLGNISFLRVISLIGFIILTLAIINYLNFSMSLQHSKLREISIKKINGAGTLQLFFYYLAETLIVVVIAIVLSILFINIFKNTFSGIFSTALNLAILKTPLFILIILLVLLIILLVNSIIPAYSLLKLNVVDGINNSIKRKNKSSIKTIFTTGQFVVSIALLMAVFFIHKQLSFIESKDLGFNRQNLLRMGIPWGFKENVALKNGIDNLNFVTSSSYSNGCPGDINLVLGSGGEENEVDFQTILIDKDFFKTFEIEVVDGRGFMGGDFKKACMFNRTGLKKIGWNDIKNRRFNNGSKDGYEVIGVVNDFNVSSLHSFQKPVCLLFDNSNAYNNLSIRIVPGEINRQIEQLKKVWESVTEAPFEVQFYDTFFNAQYKKERQLSKSISILAVVAILLTLLGILGQVIQTCVFRTKEIGIRKVNGASVLEIMSMLNLDFLKWVVVAFVIATPLAYLAITRWLENFAYKTELSWWVFVFAGVFILLISVVTVSIQTFRVARRNPIESLRYE